MHITNIDIHEGMKKKNYTSHKKLRWMTIKHLLEVNCLKLARRLRGIHFRWHNGAPQVKDTAAGSIFSVVYYRQHRGRVGWVSVTITV